MSNIQPRNQNDDINVVSRDGLMTIRGRLKVFKASGINISGEPLSDLFEEYDDSPVEITIKKTMQDTLPSFTETNGINVVPDLIKAINFMEEAHKGQTRKNSDTPYSTHPFRVMTGVLDHKGIRSTAAACAAALHDTMEDCGVHYQVLLGLFGKEVADLVLELTNPSKKFPHLSRAERKSMDRNHCASISKTAKVIKLLDRYDNINESVGLEPSFVKLYCEETKLLIPVLQDADPVLANKLSELVDYVRYFSAQ